MNARWVLVHGVIVGGCFFSRPITVHLEPVPRDVTWSRLEMASDAASRKSRVACLVSDSRPVPHEIGSETVSMPGLSNRKIVVEPTVAGYVRAQCEWKLRKAGYGVADVEVDRYLLLDVKRLEVGRQERIVVGRTEWKIGVEDAGRELKWSGEIHADRRRTGAKKDSMLYGEVVADAVELALEQLLSDRHVIENLKVNKTKGTDR